jgi:hypothetical protein
MPAAPDRRTTLLVADGAQPHCSDCYAKIRPGDRCPCWKDRLAPAEREILQRAAVARWEERWKAIDIQRQQIAAAASQTKWGSWGNKNAVGGLRRSPLGR